MTHSTWNAYSLLGYNYNWLNFSVNKNFTEKNAQNRVYKASAWDTLIRPHSEDPHDGERVSLPERIYYPELVDVKPKENKDSKIDLPNNSARDALSVFWHLEDLISSETSLSGSEIPFEAQLSSLLGNNLSYPTPILLLAFVHNDSKIIDLNIDGSIQTPEGTVMPINFTDDGISPDANKGDGLYSAIYSPEENGIYTIQALFNNNDGLAKYDFSSFAPSIGEGGPVPFPEPTLVGENFNLSKTVWVSVSNVVPDDFGNTPEMGSEILSNNESTSGKINYAGDKDVFEVKTLSVGTTFVRITNLAFGMSPYIRVIASDKVTVLAEFSLESSLGEYLDFPINSLPPNSAIYIEVSDVSSLAKGGLYDISAGKRISSDFSKYNIFLPAVLH